MKTKAEEKSKTDGALPRTAKRRKKILRIVGFTLLTVFAVSALAVCGLYIGFLGWAQKAEFRPELLPTATAVPTFLDANGQKIEYTADNYVDPDTVTDTVKAAFVALEDKRFYSHHGYDPKGIIRAVGVNIKAGKTVEGASTITQQLVKNTHLSAEKTFSRKLNEIAIAMKIEKKYTKDQILAMYLSVIYFGGGAYGINAASEKYFGCTPQELTTAQAATLAGILKNPSRYSPANSISAATERRNLVLDVMQREGYITEAECAAAKAEKMRLKSAQTESGDAAYRRFYVARAVREVCDALNMTEYELNNSGLTILTAMDPDAQNALAKITADRGNYSADNVDGAALLLDNDTGEIVAHYGTLNYEIYRQGGSVMKPLTVYAPALDTGAITLATPLKDEPCDFNGYRPQNFGGIYFGDTTPREAVKKSMNTAAVRVLTYSGTAKALEYGKKMGLPLSSADDNLALALGATSSGIDPATLAGAYAVFARGGDYIKPHCVRSVVKNGAKIYSATPSRTSVVSPQTAYLMTDCLADTVQDGTAKSLSTLPFEVAAKTGTVQIDDERNSDAWSLSYTSDRTLAVWHGGASMTELGGGHPTLHAAKIWRTAYTKGFPSDFSAPSGIVVDDVDTYSTVKNGKLTLAVPSTPSEYRRTEIFNAAFRGDTSMSRFENPHADFDVEVVDDKVTLSFEVEPVYDYTLLCSDFFGTRVVAQLNGAAYNLDEKSDESTQNPVYSVVHTPFSFGRQVTYTLQISVTKGDGTVIGTTSKGCFPSFSYSSPDFFGLASPRRETAYP